IRQLEPRQRKQLNRNIARDLRRRQRERIKAQQNPDGSPYEPRKPQHWKQGAIKRQAMFRRLRTARYLKARGFTNKAVVGFTGRGAHIARVHQYGLSAPVEPGGPRYRYPSRRLLGHTSAGRDDIAASILRHLTRT